MGRLGVIMPLAGCPAYRAVVSHLCRCAGDGDIDRSLLDIVGHVSSGINLAGRKLSGVLNDVLHDIVLRVCILLEVGHMTVNHGAGDGQVDLIPWRMPMTLMSSPMAGMLFLSLIISRSVLKTMFSVSERGAYPTPKEVSLARAPCGRRHPAGPRSPCRSLASRMM